MAKNKKNNITGLNDSKSKPSFKIFCKEKIFTFFGYIILIGALFNFAYFEFLKRTSLDILITISVISGFSAISFIVIYFSDPGRLFENFSTDLTDEQIKSIEERRSKINESDIYNDELKMENYDNENREKNKQTNGKRKNSNKIDLNILENKFFNTVGNDILNNKLKKKNVSSGKKCYNRDLSNLNLVKRNMNDFFLDNRNKITDSPKNLLEKSDRFNDNDNLKVIDNDFRANEFSNIMKTDANTNFNILSREIELRITKRSFTENNYKENSENSKIKNSNLDSISIKPINKDENIEKFSDEKYLDYIVNYKSPSGNIFDNGQYEVKSDRKILKKNNMEIETNNFNSNKNFYENDKSNHNIFNTIQETSKIRNNLESGNNLNNYNSSGKANKLDSSLHDLTEKYCVNCFIDIPIRGKHCKICHSCIATFDHHCSWVGNCIGENNRKYFLIFLLLHNILLLVSLGISIFSYQIKENVKEFFEINYKLMIFEAIILIIFFFVFPLFIFHLRILCINQTTWENYCWAKISYMKYLSGSQISPFDEGLSKNLCLVFCNKKFRENEENFINWKKIALNKHNVKSLD